MEDKLVRYIITLIIKVIDEGMILDETEKMTLQQFVKDNKNLVNNTPTVVYDVLFETFWSAYPNKKAKMDALKAWGKLKVGVDLYKIMMFALEQHKKLPQWTKDNGQFIPLPATWLNHRRWEDEIKVGGQGSTKYKDV